jgi:hypothetical protein
MEHETKKPNVIYRTGPPTKYDQLPQFTICCSDAEDKSLKDIYMQLSSREEAPLWQHLKTVNKNNVDATLSWVKNTVIEHYLNPDKE